MCNALRQPLQAVSLRSRCVPSLDLPGIGRPLSLGIELYSDHPAPFSAYSSIPVQEEQVKLRASSRRYRLKRNIQFEHQLVALQELAICYEEVKAIGQNTLAAVVPPPDARYFLALRAQRSGAVSPLYSLRFHGCSRHSKSQEADAAVTFIANGFSAGFFFPHRLLILHVRRIIHAHLLASRSEVCGLG